MSADLIVSFEAYLERMVREFDGISPTYRMVRYHFGYDDGSVGRGKRLRPQMLLRVGHEEGASTEALLPVAAAIELLHNYSLVHDDIEDRDELRHGRKTLWAEYGIAHGINAGDAMCSMSYLVLLRSLEEGLHPADRIARMVRVLHEAHLAMCGGQGLDIGFETATDVSFPEYLAMIEGKTAALFSAACELGALAADAPPQRIEAYRQLGRLYGLAFQIRDDVLGTWGKPSTTGKPSGADIARRKWSFPVAWALSGPPSAPRSAILERYRRGEPLDADDVATVVAALDRLGAREAADRATDAHLAEAAALIDRMGLDRGGNLRQLFAETARRVA